jgi:tartrate-resistant acid phosphatase type 5
MKLKQYRFLLSNAPILLMSILVGCTGAGSKDSTEHRSTSTGILIYGDSGYHLEYLDQDDYDDKFTVEQYKAKEWEDWQEDKRPVDEFEVRPYAVSPATGGVVPATGMQQISTAMKNFCRDDAICDFGLMLGDNIYPDGATLGADGFGDEKRFTDIISDPFGHLVETPDGFVSYVTLGNHDWNTSRDGGFAQIEFLEKTDGFYVDGPYYTVKPPAGNGDIELFIIDTNMMLDNVIVIEDALNDDGSEASTGIPEPSNYHTSPLTRAEKDMALWLEEKLKQSKAKWKIVVAHHPIWSSSGSKFEQGRSLRKLIMPAMCRYADAYIVGHEHTMEIHEDNCEATMGEAMDPPLVQIVSGAASKHRALNTNFMRHQEAKYPEHKTIWAEGIVWGFAHMTVKDDTASVTLLSVPNDGGSEHTVDFKYQFERRSHRVNKK